MKTINRPYSFKSFHPMSTAKIANYPLFARSYRQLEQHSIQPPDFNIAVLLLICTISEDNRKRLTKTNIIKKAMLFERSLNGRKLEEIDIIPFMSTCS